jgi:general secretion pathway protein D
LLRLAVILPLAFSVSCSAPPPAGSITVLSTPAAGMSTGARVSGPVSGADNLPPAPSAAYGTPVSLNASPVQEAGGGGNISLNFADTDIRAVVAEILGALLHANYIIDPAVHGTATLHTVSPLTQDALVPVLETLLAQNGAVLTSSNGIYRVMQSADATAAGGTILALHYADADQLAKVLAPYVAGNAKLTALPAQNAILVAGDPAARDALTNLVTAFDVDALAGQSYALYPVSTGDAKDFATAFASALGAKTGGDESSSGPVRVVPLERIDAVLVIARTPAFLRDAQRVYNVLYQVQRETVRSWHVYYLQNGRANDAAYVLQQAFTPDNVTATPTPQASGQTVSALNQDNSSSSSSGTSGTSVGGITGLGGSSGVGGVIGSSVTNAPSSGAAAALLGPLSSGGGGNAGATTDTLRIIPDNGNNSLLVYGTAAENDQVDAMLSKVDISPIQVRIDATIAEVDLNGALQYGTQFYFKSGGINGVLSTGSSAALATSFPGFVLSGSGGDAAPLAISALQSITKVNVLSSPELLVLDGQAASLQVGDLVPYLSQTSTSTTTAGAPVINSIDYRETGVILQVTPHVGANGLVTMDVAQEVSGVAPGTTTSGINSPTFTERAVTSRVAIQDGQTIGLAGLISDSDSHENAGIPFLKNIPVLGALVSTQTNQRTRTELLVLITPHVIRSQNDADALTADLREELPHASAVPAALTFAPLPGSADPDAKLRGN